jgi:uncharacterized membrane protein YeaQ/YmgE (transglycosylase-associated protein family)
MFPVAPEFGLIVLAEFLFIGPIAGVLAGLLASAILKTSRWWILLDALLGVLGFYAGFAVLIHMPWQYYWPRDTVFAIFIAAIFPILHEYYRSKRSQKTSK